MTENGWDEWRNHVLRTQERLEDSQDRLEAKLDMLVVEMANVKAAAKMWGAIGSLIVSPIIVGLVLAVFAAFK